MSNNRLTLLCLVVIGLKSQWGHWQEAKKTMTWLHTGEQSEREKKQTKNGDAVNYAVVEFVMDAGSALPLLVLHPSLLVY